MLVDFNLEEEQVKKERKNPYFGRKSSLATCLYYFNFCVSWMYVNSLLINREL